MVQQNIHVADVNENYYLKFFRYTSIPVSERLFLNEGMHMDVCTVHWSHNNDNGFI